MSPLLTSTVLALGGDRPVVAKRRLADPAGVSPGTADGEAARLAALAATEREAAWLAAARLPGVVTLRRVDGALLETHLAATATLRTLAGPLVHDPGRAVALVAAVAATVDRLHRHGLVHGRILADHVVVGGRGLDRVWLCSPSGGDAGPPDDVGAVAALVGELTAGWPRVPGWLRRLADDLDGLAGAVDGSRPVPARHLARALVAAAPRSRRGLRTVR